MTGTAFISPCGLYRYRLERDLAEVGPTVMFIMVNPSTADAEQDDPTIRKCIGFAKALGAGRLLVGNKFAFRATDVSALRTAKHPVGPENDAHLIDMMQEAETVIAGWGSLNKIPEVLRDRWKDIVRMADGLYAECGGIRLRSIGVNADGHPRHPLMLGYDQNITEWKAPWFANRRVNPGPKREHV